MKLTKDQIRELLKERGSSQREIAQKASVTEAHVSMVLNGHRHSKRIESFISEAVGFAVEIAAVGQPA